MPGLEVSGSRVPEGSPVRASVLLESVHGGILVSGTVSAGWTGACRRCLEDASGALSVPVRELCVEGGDVETTYALVGDELDLEPIAHDACILELPLAPLCREGCLGLCPECGADRNRERCSCGPAPDPRWGPLVALAGEAPQARAARSAVGPGRGPGETTE
ncbi:MAG: DUF177 domain-containing protein [Actinomycetota bacterium]|nr:DUF177 domain-containing protein [Actinomycetota bacterium]